MRTLIRRALLPAAALLLAGAPLAALAQVVPAAADVMLLTGRGTATADDGTVRILAKGEAVYPGELVSTGVNSYLNLRFKDGAYILLRPNSRFEIEDFGYEGPAPVEEPEAPEDEESSKAAGPKTAAAPAPKPAPVTPRPAAPVTPVASTATGGNSRAFFRLLRGGFRAVSGLIGKANANEYRVATPVATIGIRGTDYIVVLVDPKIAKDPVLSAAVPKGSADGGAVVGVISGGVFVANQAGQTLEVGEGQYSLTLPNGKIITLPVDPQFIRVDPIPNPKTICK